MKHGLLFIVLAVFTSAAFAQNGFKKSDKILSLGVGLGSPFWGTGYSNALPVNPMVTFESGVTDQVSLGGTVSYSSSKFDYYDWKFTGIYLGARGAYHFDVSKPNVDLYAGAGLGYVIVSVKDKNSGEAASAASGAGYSAFLGGRYYFGKKAGVHAELGYGSFSILNAGLSVKF